MKLLATILFFFLFLTGAFAQTRNVLVNTSSVVVQPTNFWSADASNARSGLGLESAATNPASVFQPSSIVLSNLANSNAADLTNITISNLGTISVTGGGTGATNAATARTNLGLGATWLTNTNTVNFRSDIGLGLAALTNTNTTNFRSDIGLGHITAGLDSSSIGSGEIKTGYRTTGIGVTGGYIDTRGIDEYGGNIDTHGSTVSTGGNIYTYGGTNSDRHGGSIITADGGGGIDTRGTGNIEFGIDGTRTSLTGTATANRSISLPNSDGILVAVNTNGAVVSPTNFWQVAPIQTLVQTFAPTVSSNSYGTNARNLYVYSMATSISGVTNTIILPTNSATFDGDAATITHNGTTSSVTAVRQAGSATNFTTISNEDESVKFIREDGQWTFYHNISYVEPIRFTDGNIESNKAASRTNLGLGFSALTNTNTTNFQVAIFNTNTAPTNSGNVTFASAAAWMEINIHTNGTTNSYRIPLFNKP